MTQRLRLWLAVIVGAAAATSAMIILLVGPETVGVREHHLQHAILILGGCAAGLLLSHARARVQTEHPAWLAPAIAAPLVGMLVMAPSGYPYLEAHAVIHAAIHLSLVALGFVATYGGERYAFGVGWAMGIMLEMMAVAAAFGYGVSPPPT